MRTHRDNPDSDEMRQAEADHARYMDATRHFTIEQLATSPAYRPRRKRTRMSDTPRTDAIERFAGEMPGEMRALERENIKLRATLTNLMPFVLEDYWPNCATPAYKEAVEAAIELTGIRHA